MNSIPFVSILIPIRNEEAYIEACLNAVFAQNYPEDQIEILVADGHSEDHTLEIIRDFRKNHPIIQVFDNPEKIVSTGLNKLISRSKGEILIRVDGHCKIAPDYVRNCVKHLQERHVDGVGGTMQSIGEDYVSQVIALAMSSKFGVGDSAFRTEVGRTKLVDTVPFPAYTREIINKVGLYDEDLVRNQDDEYNYRIRKAGGKILLASDVRSIYYSRGTFIGLWNQYYQYGFYKVRVLQKHPRQMSPRQFVPPLFVLSLLIFSILAFFFPWGLSALSGLVILYALANLITSLLVASREGWKYFFLLPLAFATLHLSYGTGFLMGLFRFWNRWRDPQGQVPEVKFD